MIDFPNGCYQDLYRFAGLVWGNPQAVIRRHQPEGIEYIDLTGYLATFQFLFVGIKHDKILVRNEYRIALDALQTDYDFGAYVLGQPGIGKSLFLIYALIQFLGQRQMVVLHTHPEFYLYFGGGSCVQAHPMTDARTVFDSSIVWALCDSNQSVQTPPDVFLYTSAHIRVVQTTSPKASCWMEWSKQVGAECYVMDIWSDREIADLATLLGLDVQRMTTLAQKWGNIPRTLLRFLHTDDQTIEHWYRARVEDAVLKCAVVMRQGPQHNLPDDSPSSFYFLRPKRTDEGVIIRMLSYMHVSTPTLQHLLAEVLQQRSDVERLEFYSALNQHALTRQAARFIYGSWFHSFVGAGRQIWYTLIPQYSGSSLPTISANCFLAPASLDTPMSPTPPYYWIAPYWNFPGIQSALVLNTGIFAFQMTVGSDSESPIKGLQILRKRLPENLKQLPWSIVFVGPEEYRVRYVARCWTGKVSFPDRRQVSIGYSAMDPVEKIEYGVTYRVYHDEPDTVTVPRDFDEELRNLE